MPVGLLAASAWAADVDPTLSGQYGEWVVGAGVQHAAGDFAGMVRLKTTTSLDGVQGPRWLVVGVDADVRGFRTLGGRVRSLAGVDVVAPERARLSLMTGAGLSARVLDDPAAAVFVPVTASAGWFPFEVVGLVARGGVDVGLVAVETEVQRLAPEVVVGLAMGGREPTGVMGVRLEAGWRRELGVGTWTFVAGVGL